MASDDDLVAFWSSYEDDGRRGPVHVLRHPGLAWRACRALGALPIIDAQPSDAVAGRAIAHTVGARGPLGVPARLMGSAALQIPADPAEYVRGRRAQTLRRKIRAAEKAGVSVREVSDPDERRALLTLANQIEQVHPDERYRVAEPRNDDLLDHDLWLVATGDGGKPLLLSVTPVDGSLATLRYFRTLGSGPAHSDSRYLMTSALVSALSERRVRWLLDTEPPGEQTNGLRHFQRMVGFRYARVRLRHGRGAPPGVALVALPALASIEPYLEFTGSVAP